jgi:hypothetical protein
MKLSVRARARARTSWIIREAFRQLTSDGGESESGGGKNGAHLEAPWAHARSQSPSTLVGARGEGVCSRWRLRSRGARGRAGRRSSSLSLFSRAVLSWCLVRLSSRRGDTTTRRPLLGNDSRNGDTRGGRVACARVFQLFSSLPRTMPSLLPRCRTWTRGSSRAESRARPAPARDSS